MGQLLSKSMAKRAHEIKEQIVSLRRHFHQFPELSFNEFETAMTVKDELTKLEVYDIKTGIGKTGVLATLHAGPGPTILLRADMDALPITEATDLEFQSKHKGVMHACGHDAHTSMLLGTARLLADCYRKGELTGTFKLLFQPAEESADHNGLTGAPYMIAAGVLDQVDGALALHACPWLQSGEIQINDGHSMANVDGFKGIIYGTGGHGGYPHLGTDPIWMLSGVLHQLYGIIGRRISPLDIGTISVGKVEAGTAHNIIPQTASLVGTLRSYTPETRENLLIDLENAFKTVEPLGGTYDLQIERGEPALNNDHNLNQLIKDVALDLYSYMKIHTGPFGLGGEDFGHMTQMVPGAMFFLGCGLPDNIQRDLHTPIFTVNEECLPMGAAILAEAAMRFTNKVYSVEKS